MRSLVTALGDGCALTLAIPAQADPSLIDALGKVGINFNDPDINTVSAAEFTAIAASAYCSQHLKRVNDNTGGPSQPPGAVGGQ
jgi:hypothetical protein